MDLSRRDVLGSSLTLLAGRVATTAANAQEANSERSFSGTPRLQSAQTRLAASST